MIRSNVIRDNVNNQLLEGNNISQMKFVNNKALNIITIGTKVNLFLVQSG